MANKTAADLEPDDLSFSEPSSVLKRIFICDWNGKTYDQFHQTYAVYSSSFFQRFCL
jgi:hypothetical protein